MFCCDPWPLQTCAAKKANTTNREEPVFFSALIPPIPFPKNSRIVLSFTPSLLINMTVLNNMAWKSTIDAVLEIHSNFVVTTGNFDGATMLTVQLFQYNDPNDAFESTSVLVRGNSAYSFSYNTTYQSAHHGFVGFVVVCPQGFGTVLGNISIVRF